MRILDPLIHNKWVENQLRVYLQWTTNLELRRHGNSKIFYFHPR